MHYPKTRISAVLFDFDGTLTRPGGIDFAGIKRAIGCPPLEPILEFLEQLPAVARQKAWAVLEEFEAAAAAAARPNDGAEALIGFLRAHRLPMGLLTRNSRDSVRTSLAKFKQVTPADFSVIITRADVANPKPHPEGVHLAATRLRTPVVEMAVIGDYRYDVDAGRQAGARTFFLSNGAPPPPDIVADHVVQSLAEFQALVAEFFGMVQKRVAPPGRDASPRRPRTAR